MTRYVITAVSALILLVVASALTSSPAARPADDVSLIAAWLVGSADMPAGTFDRPFGDSRWLSEAKDAICYTDVERVTLPKGLRLVPYDFVKPRMDHIRGGRKTDPAVIITRSVPNEPDDEPTARPRARDVRRPEKIDGTRYYYVEVAIGNMAWHWMKVAVFEKDGKSRVEGIWYMVS